MKISFLLFSLIFLVSGLLRGQSPNSNTITLSIKDNKYCTFYLGNTLVNNHNVVFSDNNTQILDIYVQERQSIILELSNSALCTNFTKNGQSFSSISSTNDNPRTIQITDLNFLSSGLYSLECGTINVKFNLYVVPKPNFSLTTVSAICHSSADPNSTKIGIQGPINGDYKWHIIQRSSGLDSSASLANNTLLKPSILNEEKITTANITLPNNSSSSGPYSLLATYKDIHGCVWVDTNHISVHTQKPYSNYAGATGIHTYTIGQPMIDIATDINADFINGVASFSDIKFSNFEVSRMTSSPANTPANTPANIRLRANSQGKYQYIEPINIGTYQMNFSVDYEDCTYKQDFSIEVKPSRATGTIVSNLTYNGDSSLVVNSNKEACINDTLKLSILQQSLENPIFLSVKGASDSIFFIPLEVLSSNNTPSNSQFEAPSTNINPIPQSIALSRKLPNPAFYFKDDATDEYIIYVKIPSVMITGEVKLYFLNTTTSISIGNININKEEIDFFPQRIPICSNDSIIFNAIPSSPNNGSFSLNYTNLDMTRMISNPNFSAVDFSQSSSITPATNAFSANGNQLNSSVLDGIFGGSIFKGGILAEIKYSYNLKYSTGENCTSVTEKIKYYPILNNKGLSFFLPSIERDPNSSIPYILDTVVQTTPELVTTPAQDAIITNKADMQFSGTWVQNMINSNNTLTYEQINRNISIGTHPINMQINNNGCIINSISDLEVLEKGQFVGLEQQLCYGKKDTFYRPDAYRFRDYLYSDSYQYLSGNQVRVYSVIYYNYNELSDIRVYDVNNNRVIASYATLNSNNIITINNKNRSNEQIIIDFSHPMFDTISQMRVEGVFNYSYGRYYNEQGYKDMYYMPSTNDINYFTRRHYGYTYVNNIVQQNVSFVQQNVLFTSLNGIFCESDTASISIITQPAYRPSTVLSIYSENNPSNSKFISNQVLNNNTFASLLDNSVSEQQFWLKFTDNISGCPIQDSTRIKFVKKPNFNYTDVNNNTNVEVCRTSNPIELKPSSSNVHLSHSNINFSSGRYMFSLANIPSTTNNISIGLTYTDSVNRCVFNQQQSLQIRQSPTIALSLQGLPAPVNEITSICKNGSPANVEVLYGGQRLDSSSINNSISGNGIRNNQFVPSLLTTNQSTINFVYNASDGCIGRASLNVRLTVPPNIELKTIDGNHLPDSICANELDFAIIGSGGAAATSQSIHSFSGKGIWVPTDTSLSTSSNSIITYSITRSINRQGNNNIQFDTLRYSNTDSNGCQSDSIHIFNIKSLPLLNISMDSVVCANAANVNIILSPLPSTMNNPSINGMGVSLLSSTSPNNYVFSPRSVYTGGSTDLTIPIKYSAKANNNCSNEVTKIVTVNPLPIVNPTHRRDICSDADTLPFRPILNPTASTYTITGPIIYSNSSGNYIVPSAALTGMQHFTMEVISDKGCIINYSDSIRVNLKPNADIRGIDNMHYLCVGNTVHADGIPVGGVFSNTSNITWPQVNAISRMNIDSRANLAGTLDTLTYIYTDANFCKDTISKVINFVALPIISGVNLVDSVCQVPGESELIDVIHSPNVAINCTGAGVDTMQGTNLFQFIPSRTNIGMQFINITATENTAANITISTLSDTACILTIRDSIKVNPLPLPNTTSITENAVYCNTNAPIFLEGTTNDEYIFTGTGVRTSTRDILDYSNNTFITVRADTLEFSNYSNATTSRQTINMIATSALGCTDSVYISFDVHTAPETYFTTNSGFSSLAATTPILDICESEGTIRLYPMPGGGQFALHRSNNSLSHLDSSLAEFNPNPAYITTPLLTDKYDTLTYTVTTNSVCTTYDTMMVRIKPIPRPQLEFYSVNNSTTPINHICLGGDSIELRVNNPNGYYRPSNIHVNNILNTMVLALGSNNTVYYTIDSTNGCSHTDTAQLTVSNMPTVNLYADPGCANTAVEFEVGPLGLNPNFEHITNVNWIFGDGNTLSNSYTQSNALVTIPTQIHNYNSPGIYNVILTVTNDTLCTASDTIRLVVSPYERVSPANAYLEDFMDDDGAWFDEKEGSNEPSNLWHWAPVTIAPMGRATSTNAVWSTTYNDYYGMNESAWVYSPCFDIDSLQRPMISLDYFSNMDNGKDGAVIEYYDNTTATWTVLGDVDRGLNWYNEDVIGGAPGTQTTAPKGWTGEINQWQTGRYVLDNLRYNGPLRFRIAFGALGLSNRDLQGFAFDNVYIGERQKNVLLEHFANNNVQNMNYVNQTVYNHVYDRNIFPYDLNLIQIHTQGDELFNFSQDISNHNARKAIYSANAEDIVVDGIAHEPSATTTRLRKSEHIAIKYYEERMLQTPEFLIEIGNVIVNNGRVSYDYTVKQNPLADSVAASDDYYIYSAIVEDYVPYSNGNIVHSFLRQMKEYGDNSQGGNLTRVHNNAPFYYQSENINLMSLSNDTTHLSNLHVVVWVQKIYDNLNPNGQNDLFANEVYQSQSSRNVLEYLVSVDEVNSEVEQQAQKMLNANLYPNPAYSYFNVDFDEAIMDNCNWKLIDARGITLQQGKLNKGDTQLQVLTEEYASGVYTFIVEHAQFKVYKKVVIYRP